MADETTATRATDALLTIVQTRPGGEVRPQQQTMVEQVAQHIADRKHLVIQAGTGVGKSFGYLVPAITSGKRVVVSTATKQLSEQIAAQDLPFLIEHLDRGGRPVSAALLKGRNNYLCLSKVNDLRNLEAADPGATQDALFDEDTSSRRPSSRDLDELNALLQWAEDPDLGDRTSAPACGDKAWSEVSSTAAACPGASKCMFGEDCFAEAAKERARSADIVVTNHALVAADMISPQPLFDEADVIVFDEAHHLQDYLSRAWGLEIVANSFKHAAADAARALPRSDTYEDLRSRAKEIASASDQFTETVASIDPGLLETVPDELANPLRALQVMIAGFAAAIRRQIKGDPAADNQRVQGSHRALDDLAKQVTDFLNDQIEAVRWLDGPKGRQPAALRTAPLWVGELLLDALDGRTMICTSATLTVGKSFEQATRVFGLLGKDDIHTALDVGTPFQYRQQAMLYIPPVDDFPAPVGADRTQHTAAVQERLGRLVEAAGGRTLALFTTRYAADQAAAYLRRTVRTPVLAQGDAPPAVLIEQFAADEATTLCATMGFWHGVDVPGPSCSLVVMDKVPFAPMNDPLMKARVDAAGKEGRNGFLDVYVSDAATMIAQGFGRLIRSSHDRGVVAILDTRIRSKGYGSAILGALPEVGVFDDLDKVCGALNRLASAEPAAAAVRVAG